LVWFLSYLYDTGSFFENYTAFYGKFIYIFKDAVVLPCRQWGGAPHEQGGVAFQPRLRLMSVSLRLGKMPFFAG